MKKLFVFLCAMVFGCGGTAHSATWTNSPEDTLPGWVTTAPYQREIYWDFSVNPEGSGYLLPGAEYSGIYDSQLGSSDWFDLTGDVIYDPAYGGVGIWNTGSSTMYGEMVIHIGNLVNDNPLKHVYLEAINHIISPPTFSFYAYLEGPGDFNWSSTYFNSVMTSPLVFLVNEGFEITPNPVWEEFHLYFEVPAGGQIWVEDFHIVTECVPIPSAVWLLGSGLIGIVGLRRKFRKT